MMMNCKDCEQLFSEALYNELGERQLQLFQKHLDHCSQCRQQLNGMQMTLQIMDKRKRREPDAAFWDNYWDQLEKNLSSPEVVAPRQVFIHSWSFRLMAAALVLISGIFIGREWSSFDHRSAQHITGERTVDPGYGHNNGQNSPAFTSRAVQMRTANYLNRSKVLVLGLINLDDDTEELNSFDFNQHKRISNELLQEAGYLKQALDAPQSRRLQSLVVDLEAILLEITTLSQQSDIPSVERVRVDVENRGILFKINMEEMRRQLNRNDLESQQESI